MSPWRGKRPQAVVFLGALGLVAGCTTPRTDHSADSRRQPPVDPVIQRTVATPPIVAAQKKSEGSGTRDHSGKIRLSSQNVEPETPDLDEPVDNESQVASGQPADSNNGSPRQDIDMETVLQLTNGQNPQVAFARERIQEAFAQLDRARVLWLPSLRAGVTYDKHDGPAQAVDGPVINVSRSALFSGFGGVLPGAATPAIPGLYANFQLTDAIFQPRIAERTAASRQ